MPTAPAFEDTVAVEERPSFESTSPVEETPRFEDTAPIEAENKPGILEQITQLPKVARAALAQVGLTTAAGLQAQSAREAERMGKPKEGLIGKLFSYPPPAPGMVEELQQESAGYIEAAKDIPEQYGLNPKLEAGLITQAGRGLTKGAGMFAVANVLGIPGLALQGSAESYGEAKAAGKTDDEADKAATRSMIGLAIFGAANKGVASGIARYLGNASKLKTFLVQALGQTAGNEVTSRAIAAYQAALDAAPGKRHEAAVAALTNNDPATIAQNFGFGVMGGLAAAKTAGIPKILPSAEETRALGNEIDANLQKIAAQEPPGAPEASAPVSGPSEAIPSVSTVPTEAPRTAPAGERIISTGIISEEGIKTGPEWKSSHAEIIKNNPELALDENVDQRKGLIIQDAEGNQRFVGRKEALEVARKSGQVDESLIRSATEEGLISEALIEPKLTEPYAQTIRSDQGPIYEQGNVQGQRPNARGEDLQRGPSGPPIETGAPHPPLSPEKAVI